MNPSEGAKHSEGAKYQEAGVLTNTELGLEALLKSVRRTEDHRRGRLGLSVLDVGYFANVVDIGRGMGLALSTDGVGSKVLIAEMTGRYDTIGIDCVAMNVNDVICVGAEPMSMLDYIGIERATPQVLEAIGRGLYEGARQARVNIVGGEISQIPEIIRGTAKGSGLDLIGMCVGLVPIDKVNVGQDVVPGDVIIGLESNGIHSNGLSLARRVFFERAGFAPDRHLDELGKTVGEELLVPTRIYVQEVVDLLEQGLPIHAMIHVTSDGLFNLTRIKPAVGFVIDNLPPSQPVFDCIGKLGGVDDAEMYRVFNMGVGFCLIVPDDPAVLKGVADTMRRHDTESFRIGKVVEDPERHVWVPQRKLVGKGDYFTKG
jgi:phosphoribosylformylglycinamidine cyclo-ligase